ncbi:hypothetical protein D3C71_2059470 [compost metagenome]
MREVAQLLLDGRHDTRMAMAGVEYGDAGGEVDVLLAFDIGDQRVVGLRCMEVTHDADAAGSGCETALFEVGVGAHGVHSKTLK